ncbi:hypothetical protein GBA52_015218, partial [Prunus armeniaca]
ARPNRQLEPIPLKPQLNLNNKKAHEILTRTQPSPMKIAILKWTVHRVEDPPEVMLLLSM